MSSQQNPFGREDPTNQKNITSLDDEYALTVTPDIPATYYQGRRFQTGDQPGLQTYWPTEQNAPWTSYAQWNQDDAYDEFLEGNPASYDPQLANQMGRTGIPGANPSYMESVQPRGGTSGSGEPSASGIDWYMGHFEGAQSMQSQTPYPHGIHVPLQQSQDSDVEQTDATEKEKPWQCERCPARFARKRDCTRHVRSVHTQDSPYGCLGCGVWFVRSDARGRHWKLDPTCASRHKQAGGEPTSKSSSPVA